MNSSFPREISPSPLVKPFLDLCQKIREYLEEQVQRETLGLPLAASLERTPDGELCLRKQLPIGLTLLGTPNPEDPKIAILRIFFDPVRFRTWVQGMGPMGLVYMDPYGIELAKARESKRWGLYLDGRELYMDLETDQMSQIARVEIREKEVLRLD